MRSDGGHRVVIETRGAVDAFVMSLDFRFKALAMLVYSYFESAIRHITSVFLYILCVVLFPGASGVGAAVCHMFLRRGDGRVAGASRPPPSPVSSLTDTDI